jgi:hypothetical protein
MACRNQHQAAGVMLDGGRLQTRAQAAGLDVTDELKKGELEALCHWHDTAADHDVRLMVYKDKVLVEVADVVLRQKLQAKQGKK